MKIIVRNSSLVFETFKNQYSADLSGGYAINEQGALPENSCILIDFTTGNNTGDSINPQTLFNGNATGDGTRILLHGDTLASLYKNASEVTIANYIAPNTRFKILFSLSGKTYFSHNGYKLEKVLTAGSGIDNVQMFGCRRKHKTHPFLGTYNGIYIKENIKDEEIEAWYNNPEDGCSHMYLPENINGLVWKDSIGNIDLTLSNEAVVNEIAQ